MGRFLPITIAATVLLALSPAWAEGPLEGFYTGKIGGKYPVTLSLEQSGDTLSGYYHYDKYRVDIPVVGVIAEDGTISLEEYGFLATTGLWEITLDNGVLRGQWSAEDGSRTLPFELSPTALKTKAKPGQPIGDSITLSAVPLEPDYEEVPVPGSLAATLFAEMVDKGDIDRENEYFKDVVALGDSDPAQLFNADRIDLNGDGAPEWIVYPSDAGACSANNCSIWLFQTKPDGSFRNILTAMAGYAGYQLLRSTTNGYHDVVLSLHSSAMETIYEIHRFDGNAYHRAACVRSVAQENDKGDITVTDTEMTCEG